MSKNKTEINRTTTIEKIKNKLESLGISQEKGSIIYSGNETLRKGRFYFMGINPGGHSDEYSSKFPDTIKNQLLRKNTNENFNEYLDGKWQNKNTKATLPGKSLLQKRIQYLFKEIDVNIRDVFSTNLVFIRSSTTNKFPYKWNEEVEKCWKIHEILLSIVNPEIIITFGLEPYEFIKDKMILEQEDFHAVKSKKSIKYFTHLSGYLYDKKIRIISIPHLSRFKIDAKGKSHNDLYDVRAALSWLKEKVNN